MEQLSRKHHQVVISISEIKGGTSSGWDFPLRNEIYIGKWQKRTTRGYHLPQVIYPVIGKCIQEDKMIKKCLTIKIIYLN